jgi:hypothetical protein
MSNEDLAKYLEIHKMNKIKRINDQINGSTEHS